MLKIAERTAVTTGNDKTKWFQLEQAFTNRARDFYHQTKTMVHCQPDLVMVSEEVQGRVKKKKDEHKEWLRIRSEGSIQEKRSEKEVTTVLKAAWNGPL